MTRRHFHRIPQSTAPTTTTSQFVHRIEVEVRRLWLTSEWSIELRAVTPAGEVVEHQEHVIGPLWSAQQAEDAAYEMKIDLEVEWGLRRPFEV